MKRILKLKGELVLFAVISILFAVFLCTFIRSNYIVSKKTKDQKIQFLYENYITPLTSSLKKADLENKDSCEKAIYSFGSGSPYTFYVVNKDGDVIASNIKDVKKIDSSKVQNGTREVEVKSNEDMSEITTCDYLKDGYYLYLNYLGNTDPDFSGWVIIVSVILSIIIFILLCFGRIAYIVSIRKSIKLIAQGDFSHRIPLKYKNELRELAEDINYMVSELQSEDEKRKEFLTNISHDLRTPLTSILGYLSMINEKKYDDAEECRSYIDKINKKALFLKSMLNDFFQYSKLSSKDIEISKEDIYIQELVRQLINEEVPVFENNNLKLCFSFQEEVINIKGDGELLARALSNLLSNALKYSKKNSEIMVKVYNETIDSKKWAVIYISNTPKETLKESEVKKFFQRLYKKEKSRSDSGSGLGLSIVTEIAKIHNGFIKGSIENEEVVFRLFLQ